MFQKLQIILVLTFFNEIFGHGMLMDPVNRASRWRKDGSTPRDYNDMEGFCGGFNIQWGRYGGKCGMCGDSFGDKTPRNHELGGYFGKTPVIVATYKRGSTISVTAKITANHRGYFYFRICNVDNARESDECFEQNKVLISTGSTYPLPSTESKDYTLSIILPSNLVCNHCVLQWTYVAGNNWGDCGNGTGKLGCGPQEHFRTCSDIRITN